MSTVDLNVNYIIDEVIKRLQGGEEDNTILVEASGRHVHLSQNDVDTLFGKGYQLTNKRELSQPGQYLCEEKVTLIGPKGIIQNVSVLGPVRENTQVELSKSDAVSIGVKAPVRMSGDIKGTPSVIIATPKAALRIEEGVIAAKRHMHITPEDAAKFGVKDREEIKIRICGERGLIFENVAVRVSDKFNTAIHLDYDEANACGFTKGLRATIVK
ncbi:MAG: phosphate propanoyltransferase [Clostridium argentinense]|uniref:Phosphate propanoyltransferase n=1 Tax=Clostridium faecium TaxID=2762223 RepID=A0ABR8YMS0_9CLOT|nr:MULTISPECIES: ethanolamine utilization phosphate acetyltransferase EutD [Clostridium]MBD8045538.1 phosphate propanoyltransferase [Clostridium faecium]MBS5824596.1 phosphate propanoyltransferase [Clostridium argentinense]MDU1350351.1 ethanolamine utilization phosphate acetyltransferase EutD [Clostridium argentinense]